MSHNAKELPSQDEIDTRYSYDPDTGVFLSKLTLKDIKRQDSSGYRIVTIEGKVRRVNRLIWKLQTGEDPEGIVDAIDNDPLNQKWSNLRVVSEKEFYARKRERSMEDEGDITSKKKGVTYYRRSKNWRVQLRIDGVTYSKYGFSTEAEALAWSENATKEALERLDNKEKLEQEKMERQEIIDDLFGED